jgi:hypothetical protein
MELLSTVYVDHNRISPRGVTEPKDALFALLSLAKDASQFGDQLQYTMSLNGIFRETAHIIIQNGQINLLSYCWTPSGLGKQARDP